MKKTKRITTNKFVECFICKKHFKSLDGRHLKRQHNIRTDDYLEMYPDAKLITLEESNRLSFLVSGENNPFYGKSHTQESIDKALETKNGHYDKWKKNVTEAALINNRKPEFREKISKTISKMIADGKIKPFSNHVHGYYVSKITGEKEYYESSYELKRMKQLDEQGINWTKKHGIIIPYLKDGIQKNYIPDFLVNNVIEEIKPEGLVDAFDNKEKRIFAKKFCELNGYEYRIITEKELQL